MFETFSRIHHARCVHGFAFLVSDHVRESLRPSLSHFDVIRLSVYYQWIQPFARSEILHDHQMHNKKREEYEADYKQICFDALAACLRGLDML